MSISILDQYYPGINGVEDRGSGLKWLAELEKDSFENFNMFDDQTTGFSLVSDNALEKDNFPDPEIEFSCAENKDPFCMVPVDSMSVILKIEAPLDSVSKPIVNAAITISANGGHVQVHLKNIFELDSKNRASKMAIQQLLDKEFASEFYKVIESERGVTVLVRNYFDVNAHDIRRMIQRLADYVQEKNGLSPKIIVNGLEIEYSTKETLWP